MAKNGRYGPYVSHNGINATLPNDKTPDTITVDEAVSLLDARAESGGGSSRRKRPARKETGQEGSARKAAAARPRRQAEEARSRERRGQDHAQIEADGSRTAHIRTQPAGESRRRLLN